MNTLYILRTGNEIMSRVSIAPRAGDHLQELLIESVDMFVANMATWLGGSWQVNPKEPA